MSDTSQDPKQPLKVSFFRDIDLVRTMLTIVIGLFVVLAAFAVSICILLGKVDPNNALVGAVVGYMLSESKQVVNYFFGSSADSANKNELLLQSTPPPS